MDKFVLHTGNILYMNELIRKAGQNPSEELKECMKITLEKWSPVLDAVVPTIHVNNEAVEAQINMIPTEREDYKVTVKVFLCNLSTNLLSEALNAVFSELETDHLESLILSYPLWTRKLDVKDLLDTWQLLESYVESKKILSLGVSDLDTDLFVDLYNTVTVKPSIIQINLATCCVVPPELATYAKEKGVQLLTHNDPIELLPGDTLRTTLSAKLGNNWSLKPAWIVRYQIHVKCRGLLSHKGYVCCATPLK